MLDLEIMMQRDRYVALGLYVGMFLALAIASIVWAFLAGASSARRTPGCDDACKPAAGELRDGRCMCRQDFTIENGAL